MAAIHGIAKLDRKTKKLVKRLTKNDIAVIDHADIDAVSAEELVESGTRAVINNSPSTSGSYPNLGPLILADSGVHLVDVIGVDLFKMVKEGDPIRIEQGLVYSNGSLIADGRVLDRDHVALAVEQGRREIGKALQNFADNTVSYLREEQGLLATHLNFPHFDTAFRDRHVLIVVRGIGFKKDLQALRPYIREVKPVLVGVDGGGDALIEVGLRPDVIVGDMDSASDRSLSCGAELVLHAYPGGDAPGRARLDELGLKYKAVPAPGTSQDLAMLVTYEQGASLIVSVGSHFNLVEFLDKGRRGMSSTFLTRLRIGDRMVDAKGVSRLYRPGVGSGQLLLLISAALIAIVVVFMTSPHLRRLADLVWLKIKIAVGI